MIYNLNITKMLYSFKHINESYYKLSSEVTKRCGITKPEADILAFLFNNPECDTAKDIVQLKGLSKAYVSKAVEPLLKKGLISIEIDKYDRRCQHLKLTSQSEEIVSELHNMQMEFLEKLTDNIPEEDILKFLEVIDKLANNSHL